MSPFRTDAVARVTLPLTMVTLKVTPEALSYSTVSPTDTVRNGQGFPSHVNPVDIITTARVAALAWRACPARASPTVSASKTDIALMGSTRGERNRPNRAIRIDKTIGGSAWLSR